MTTYIKKKKRKKKKETFHRNCSQCGELHRASSFFLGHETWIETLPNFFGYNWIGGEPRAVIGQMSGPHSPVWLLKIQSRSSPKSRVLFCQLFSDK